MTVVLIQAKIKPERVADVDAAAEKMFAAIHAAQPEGVKYASTRLAAEGESVVALLVLDDPEENPLQGIPEFGEFQDKLPEWLAGPPTVAPLTVIGSYELF